MKAYNNGIEHIDSDGDGLFISSVGDTIIIRVWSSGSQFEDSAGVAVSFLDVMHMIAYAKDNPA